MNLNNILNDDNIPVVPNDNEMITSEDEQELNLTDKKIREKRPASEEIDSRNPKSIKAEKRNSKDFSLLLATEQLVPQMHANHPVKGTKFSEIPTNVMRHILMEVPIYIKKFPLQTLIGKLPDNVSMGTSSKINSAIKSTIKNSLIEGIKWNELGFKSALDCSLYVGPYSCLMRYNNKTSLKNLGFESFEAFYEYLKTNETEFLNEEQFYLQASAQNSLGIDKNIRFMSFIDLFSESSSQGESGMKKAVDEKFQNFPNLDSITIQTVSNSIDLKKTVEHLKSKFSDQIKSLSLNMCKIEDDLMDVLSGFDKLEELKLGSCKSLNDFSFLENLKVKKLTLREHQTVGELILKLSPALENLTLSGFTCDSIKFMQKSPSIARLKVFKAECSKLDFSDLVPNLHLLSIEDIVLDDKCIENIENCTSLRKLWIKSKNNPAQEITPIDMKKLSNLYYLYIVSNAVSLIEIPANLEELSLVKCENLVELLIPKEAQLEKIILEDLNNLMELSVGVLKNLKNCTLKKIHFANSSFFENEILEELVIDSCSQIQKASLPESLSLLRIVGNMSELKFSKKFLPNIQLIDLEQGNLDLKEFYGNLSKCKKLQAIRLKTGSSPNIDFPAICPQLSRIEIDCLENDLENIFTFSSGSRKLKHLLVFNASLKFDSFVYPNLSELCLVKVKLEIGDEKNLELGNSKNLKSVILKFEESSPTKLFKFDDETMPKFFVVDGIKHDKHSNVEVSEYFEEKALQKKFDKVLTLDNIYD